MKSWREENPHYLFPGTEDKVLRSSFPGPGGGDRGDALANKTLSEGFELEPAGLGLGITLSRCCLPTVPSPQCLVRFPGFSGIPVSEPGPSAFHLLWESADILPTNSL